MCSLISALMGKNALMVRDNAAYLGISFLVASSSYGYTETTHQLLSVAAYKKSVLATDSSFFDRLGFSSTQQFSTFIGNVPVKSGQGTAEAVVAYGARYEDGIGLNVAPHVAFYHFFDPQHSPPNGRGLVIGGIVGTPSPDWILETRGTSYPLQHYSYAKAQAQFYNALTARSASERLNSFSMVIQSLGHMVHHIQDMAQPQHVRNEAHLDVLYKFPEAVFEEFAQAELTDGKISQLVAAKNYPVPSALTQPAFKRATDYWYSEIPSYAGMAEFTSKNFVTYNTGYIAVQEAGMNGQWNIKPSLPAFPLPNGTNVTDQSLKQFVNKTRTEVMRNGQTLSFPVGCIEGKIYDSFFPLSVPNKILLACSTLRSKFSPNYRYFNWDHPNIWSDNHSVLVPRAVSFSAGLINHFFRGQVGISNIDGASWRITNEGAESTSGVYTILSESPSGNRQQLSQFPLALAARGTSTVNFNPPDDTVKIVVAYSGRLGEESDQVHGRVVSFSKADSSVLVTVNPGPITSGDSVSMRATVSGKSPSGTVQFLVDGIARGNPIVVDVAGNASSDSGALTQGYHRIIAKYSGDAVNKAKLSSEVGVTVNPPAIPCGTPVSAFGGKAGINTTMDMGENPGKVKVEFEAFSIPDGLIIKSTTSGKVFVNTAGLVSGYSKYEFNFNSLEERGRFINFTVTGNSDVQTGWALSASCPGQNLKEVPMVNVALGVDFDSNSNRCGRWDFIINNNMTVIGNFAGAKLASNGNHLVRAVKNTSGCPVCYTCSYTNGGYPFYNAGKGKVYIRNGQAVIVFVPNGGYGGGSGAY